MKKGEIDRAIADYDLAIAFDSQSSVIPSTEALLGKARAISRARSKILTKPSNSIRATLTLTSTAARFTAIWGLRKPPSRISIKPSQSTLAIAELINRSAA